MKKIIIGLLVSIGVLLSSSLDINKDIKLQYFMKKDGSYQGMFIIDKNKNSLETKYYNIDKSNKIPFLYKKKYFDYTIIDDKMILDTIKVGKIKRSYKYDLSKLDEEMIDLIGVSKVDMKRRSVIFNKEDLPDYTIDKSQLLSVEALLVSMVTNTFDFNKKFHLYEPQKKLMLKVELKKEKNETLNINGKSIKTKKYLLKVAGKKKRLLNIYLTKNNTPIRVASTKKRWQFDLVGVGQFSKHTVEFKDDILDSAKMDLESKSVEKILSSKYSTSIGDHIVTSDVIVPIDNIDDNIIKNNIKSSSFKTKKSKDQKVYKVTVDEVIKNIEDKHGFTHTGNFKFVKKHNENLSKDTMMRIYENSINKSCKRVTPEGEDEDILMCNGKEKKDLTDNDIDSIVKHDIGKKKFQNLEISTSMMSSDIEYSYEESLRLSKKEINKTIKNMLINKIGKYVNLPMNKIIKSGNSYMALVDILEIKKEMCNKKSKSLGGQRYGYKNGKCSVYGIEKRTNMNSYKKSIKSKIISKYPAVKWLNKEIKSLNEHSVQFDYLFGYKGLNDDTL